MKAHSIVVKWFSDQGWEPFDFQFKVWQHYLCGESGLIHASTGTGKTYAAYMGAVLEYLDENNNIRKTGSRRADFEPLRVLWITPLRALAADTEKALLKPVDDLKLNWLVEKRTGDTSSYTRSRQSKKLPTVLIITPESLSILLSYPNYKGLFASLRLIIADEWHELMGSKRGILTQLAVRRLLSIKKDIRIWGLSATLGNTETAMQVLLGSESAGGILVRGRIPKETLIETILPPAETRFPWGGHLGLTLLPEVTGKIEEAESCIVFTNTRSQTEAWFQAILEARPDWAGIIALHHGSLDREERNNVEEMLRTGRLKCVVSTSSLDLGVDFSPVDRVIQIGSPKGIARLLQRAGRSGHQPGKESSLICVPTNSFELIEFAAVHSALSKNFIEPRETVTEALDVLVQHLNTAAAGGGFYPAEMYEEVRRTHAFKDLTKIEWEWVLSFISTGGPALRAYPEYSRVIIKDGLYIMEDRLLIRRHRMSIGTITSNSMMSVKFLRGGSLGSIEESFIAKLKRGDTFVFAGRQLEYVRIKDMTVLVRVSGRKGGAIPQWLGGKMPLSTELASEVRLKLDEAKNGNYHSPEMQHVKPILELQQKWSVIPAKDEFLIEQSESREGFHLFFYPFEGKLVHQGLASLISYRLGKVAPSTFSISTNDYGFELLSHSSVDIDAAVVQELLKKETLLEDILHSLNSSEMAKRQFREIARVAGLVFQGYPGASKNTKQVQVSSGLLYDVFNKYDPDNLLIKQASREVLQRQLEESRLSKTLERLANSEIRIEVCRYFTPLAFPIMVNRFREKLSTEKLSDRIKRMQLVLEKAAGKA